MGASYERMLKSQETVMKKMHWMQARNRFVALLVAGLAAPAVMAQGFPSKPIRIVVPFGPGSAMILAVLAESSFIRFISSGFNSSCS